MALMKAEGLNAKEFALQTGISAATMSNILNGRNNPSLEVMQKVLNRFRTVSTNWLILGVGSMYLDKSNSQDDILPQNSQQNPEFSGLDTHPDDFDSNNRSQNNPSSRSVNNLSQSLDLRRKSSAINASHSDSDPSLLSGIKSVTHILVFYNDGTFEEFKK